MGDDGPLFSIGNAERYRDNATAASALRPDLPGQAPSQSGTGSLPRTDDASKAKSLLQSSLPAAPVLALPSGGGAVKGMGEKFSVNSSNGTGSFSVPIKVSPGRSGLQPSLSLNYDSGNGNGEFGLGWRLSGVDAITRKTSKGVPRYNDHGPREDTDVFVLAGLEDLVPLWKRDVAGNVVFDSDKQPRYDEEDIDGHKVRAYAPRILSVFNRIERWTSLADANEVHWRVISADNVTSIFGLTAASRIYDTSSDNIPANTRIFSWLQTELYDSRGNAMTFTYKREDAADVKLSQANELHRSQTSRKSNLYLKRIRYGNINPNRDLTTWEAFSATSLPQTSSVWKYSLVFDYGEHADENPKPDDDGRWSCRSDAFSRYNAGFELRTYRLCQRVLMFHHFQELETEDSIVSSVDFSYDESPTVTYLIAAQQVGYSGNGRQQPPLRKRQPPVEFGYSRFPSDDTLSDLVVENVDLSSVQNLPAGLDNTSYRWLDLDGEGISGILTVQPEAWYYKRNTSPTNYSLAPSGMDPGKVQARFGPLEFLKHGPFPTASAWDMQFSDVTGNGKLDLVSHVAQQWGFYERNDDEPQGWLNFRPFLKFPNVRPGHSVQFLDLTGDGLADILIYDDQVFTWYSSRQSDGYGPPQSVTQPWDEREGPVSVFADSQQSIFLADMSGDGLVDICRIRNGDCCYWPQLGHGNFGRQVCFDNAPWSDYSDQFDHSRIRVADVDGSGTSDILYLSDAGVEIYQNQAGNSFSAKKTVPMPAVNRSATFNTVDLLGNGTQCMVWSSPLPCDKNAPMRYVDIFANVKPHLLVRMNNNLGAETTIRYAPSTKFYLADQEKGNDWITKVHFPVHVVDKIETQDLVTGNKFTTSYRYAHGFYDGTEREFRGFARMEQIERSRFADGDSAWCTPPVRTVSWFHTGAYYNSQRMEDLLFKEVFHARDSSGRPVTLQQTIMPPDCTEGFQQMEACRALKGKLLRREVYAEDGSDRERIPYSVQETNYIIVARQPIQDSQQHGIYHVHPRETLASHYERNPEDARVAHQISLEVDDFGNVRKDIRISYGRHPGKSELEAEDRLKQETLTMIYNEVDVTNSLEGRHFRVPAPCSSRQYEVRGLKPNGTNALFRFDDMVKDDFAAILLLPSVPSSDWDKPDAIPVRGRRLLRQERALFQADNLSDILPIGKIENLGLPGAYHQLVFTKDLFAELYASPDTTQPLLSASEVFAGQGYIDLDGDGNVWTNTAKVSYTSDPSTDELAEARRSFFLPKTFVDIFGNTSTVSYDAYSFFPVGSRDAAGNVSTITMNYRALKPATVTDLNGNVSSAAYDSTGSVAGVAISGKPSDNLGDTMLGFQPDLSQEALDRFLSNPDAQAAAALLGNATSRVLYDPWRMKDHGLPIYSAFISRETHVNSPVPRTGALFQVQITYSDGFGREIQVKTHTKAGPLGDRGPDVPDRWVGSGWKVFNSKGKPVKQFEPFFDTSAEYQPDMKVGVSPLSLYDALDRVVAVTRFDANDNVEISDPRNDPDVGQYFKPLPLSEFLPSWFDTKSKSALLAEREAANRTLSHRNTPQTSFLDGLGRVFLVTTSLPDTVRTTTDLDILGNGRVIRDALSRKVTVSAYDMCQRKVSSTTIDSGWTCKLLDGADKESMTWNNRGFRLRIESDRLRRPKNTWWLDANATSEVLTSQIIYGEDFPSLATDDAAAHNLRGKVWQVLDQSGIVTNSDYDLAGNITHSLRKLSSNYKQTFGVSMDMPLEDGQHESTEEFDILRRPVRSNTSDGTITSRVYDQSTQLSTMYVNVDGQHAIDADPTSWTLVLNNVQYNARGQVTSIMYGNGTTTTCTYDRLRSRLRQLQTTGPGNGNILQDLSYTYDAVGNITNIQDAAQQTAFFRNTVVDASSSFEYDALYRLISATGREHLGQTNGRPQSPTAPDWSDSTHSGSDVGGTAMGRYTEKYRYDLCGNLLSLQHLGSTPQAPGWTRDYAYNEPGLVERGPRSNRLSSTTVSGRTESYRYHDNAGLTGNMTSMPHLRVMRWDFADRLQATSKQSVSPNGTQTPETTYYSTTSAAHASARSLKERTYFASHETFARYAPNSTAAPLKRTTFHARTEYGHIADFCTRTSGTDDGVPFQLRFRLHNHLGSAVLELSDTAKVLSYEEFFPFGATSYRATPGQVDVAKRYRFTDKELDAENGLHFFGARYYAAWLGRWTAADPVVGARTRYDYAADNPIRLVDPDGRQPKPAGDGGGGGSGGWIDVPSGSVLGSLTHIVALAALQERLSLRIPPILSYAEYRTLTGGSKSNPGGDTTGEIDLAVLLPKVPTHGKRALGRPGLQIPIRNATLREILSHRPGTLGRVTDARPGSIIEYLDRADQSLPPGSRILDPITFSTPLGDVRINLGLQDTDAKGSKARGLILYQSRSGPRTATPRPPARWPRTCSSSSQPNWPRRPQCARASSSAKPFLLVAVLVVTVVLAHKARPDRDRRPFRQAERWMGQVGGWGALVVAAVAIALTGVGAVAEGGMALGAGGTAAAAGGGTATATATATGAGPATATATATTATGWSWLMLAPAAL
ncbi:Mono(ADP-ribosyl)transferase SpvB [Cyphellophora attinorum]|uniref:Mono(ADP-ribosyl)transferase SpvB n=1 Tax=Cyphellophora attinorum TaxID=1664694 RepID=A0A0N0NNS6_9EURO|nr:Mono(ADP-ribosyl)transferase SpvB [Phialophora attinorum]KPI41931.1 Mono(ADP-ribosyl)transferase SpvB [Phialophora attinorum]